MFRSLAKWGHLVFFMSIDLKSLRLFAAISVLAVPACAAKSPESFDFSPNCTVHLNKNFQLILRDGAKSNYVYSPTGEQITFIENGTSKKDLSAFTPHAQLIDEKKYSGFSVKRYQVHAAEIKGIATAPDRIYFLIFSNTYRILIDSTTVTSPVANFIINQCGESTR
jgi:hypothetical protein